MKFLIDADSPHSLIGVFKKYSYNAVHVRDIMGSTSDDKILEYANKNHYIVITGDLGFAGNFLEKKVFGLLLIRLPHYFTADKINKVFDEFLKEINANDLVNSITVIEPGRYRIKKI